MKAAVVLSIATSALGAIVARDAATVNGVIDTAGKDIQALTEAVSAYSGDKDPLVKAADKLVSDLKAGKQKVSGSGDLGLSDAALLAGPVQKLAGDGSKLTDALKAKKSEVEKAGECKLVQTQISDIYNASNDLIDTVVGLVSDEAAKPVAEKLAGQLTTVLDDAKSAFAQCGGSDSGDSSSSDSGKPTGAQSSEATKPTESAQPTGGNGGGDVVVTTTDCPPSGTGGVQPTNTNMPPVVTGAAAAFAPAGVLAAVAAAFAL